MTTHNHSDRTKPDKLSSPKRAEPAPAQQTPAATSVEDLAVAAQARVDPRALTPPNVVTLQSVVGNQQVARMVAQAGASSSAQRAGQGRIQAKLTVNTPGDTYEQEADSVAAHVMTMPDPRAVAQRENETPATAEEVLQAKPEIQRAASEGGFETSDDFSARVSANQGSGSPLPAETRDFMEPRMGADFSAVRVHTNSEAVQLSQAVQAQAFTHGSDIYFGEGKYDPASGEGKQLLAHELTHVVQQTGGVQRQIIQRAIDPNYPVTNGEFHVNAAPQNAPPGSTAASLPITIEFEPDTTAPYSNQIGLIQVVRDVNSATGENVEPQSLPAARGADLRTQTTDGPGVEAGFFTDVLHNDAPATGGAGADTPQGSALPPQYPFGNGPAQPSPTTPGLSRPFSSGGGGAIIGYKRSNDPADIKAAEITDAPGSSGDRNFDFETVAKGEDTMTIYGALKWGFEIRSGVIQNDHASVDDSQSATFDAALERHRDFYVHEPVIFYFDFDRDTLNATETAKIDTLIDYLARNTDVRVTPQGFADMRGGRSDYNLDLSLRRAEAVAQALRDKGVAESQIDEITIGSGATDDFTQDATTDQDREANRRANRRVVLTFEHVPDAGGGGAGGAP